MTHPTPHPSNVSGRPINPDTGNPLPSITPQQQALVAELLGNLRDRVDPDGPLAVAVTVALAEAVVREHGRTLRSCLAELRHAADEYEAAARRIAADATVVVVVANELASAARQAANARALRDVHLRGDR